MTKNFKISEFECKGNLKGCECKMTANVKNNLLKLAEQLQILRDYLGVPIKINSGFRCADYNDNFVMAPNIHNTNWEKRRTSWRNQNTRLNCIV